MLLPVKQQRKGIKVNKFSVKLTIRGDWKLSLSNFFLQAQRPASPTCAVSGVPGVPGVPGLNGRDGAKGDGGPVGVPGKKGPKGSSGTKGDQGPVGPPGKTGAKGSQGNKGEKGPTGLVPQRNWKQCAWKALNDNKDYGLIKVSIHF